MPFRATVIAAATGALLCASPAFARTLISNDHVPAPVRLHEAKFAGAADPSRVLRLQVALPMRRDAEREALLAAITDPGSPLFRHYLSVAEFTRRFGPARRDYERALAFFRNGGLQVTGTTPNRYLIQLDGRIGDIERVFHLRLNLYRRPDATTFMAPDREPSVDLATPLLCVEGLDDYLPPYPKMKATPPDATRIVKTGSGPDGDFIGSDFRKAYYGGG